ncbi:hypothetical protein AG4045_027934 [Apium graveolens]|uniref:Leucine-rich repeat-containing N-terminal plant-type domain-containing protein n=1 Tax=Apium graveolens TaxID=4045 RepID=A0A6L5BBR1_APIGR|nr:hypothetical protein AG4045_027934 [Apium graveolens]
MTTLTALDLSRNYFSGKVPSLAIMSQLSYLSLAHNNFTNNIPASFANLTSLTYLDLNHNRFSGIVPSWFMNLTRLTHLDLSYNPWKGSVPTSLSQIENLEFLNLFHANLSGIVELDIFLSLKKLTTLKLSQNYFSVVENNITNITLPQFKYLALSGCKMTKFPHFLQFQDELEDLFLDDNRIQGLIPEYIWNRSKESMDSVWLGGNQLTGFEHNPVVLPWTRLRLLALWNNMMEGRQAGIYEYHNPAINWGLDTLSRLRYYNHKQRIEPKAYVAASGDRQSDFNMLDSTKGITRGPGPHPA